MKDLLFLLLVWMSIPLLLAISIPITIVLANIVMLPIHLMFYLFDKLDNRARVINLQEVKPTPRKKLRVRVKKTKPVIPLVSLDDTSNVVRVNFGAKR